MAQALCSNRYAVALSLNQNRLELKGTHHKVIWPDPMEIPLPVPLGPQGWRHQPR